MISGGLFQRDVRPVLGNNGDSLEVVVDDTADNPIRGVRLLTTTGWNAAGNGAGAIHILPLIASRADIISVTLAWFDATLAFSEIFLDTTDLNAEEAPPADPIANGRWFQESLSLTGFPSGAAAGIVRWNISANGAERARLRWTVSAAAVSPGSLLAARSHGKVA